MKGLKTRYKVLIGLMLATTAVLVGIHIGTAIAFSKPEVVPQALSYKDVVILKTLMFIPVYLGVLFLWRVGVKIVEDHKKSK